MNLWSTWWPHVGKFLVSRTDDDPLLPCVRLKRPHVYRHHAHTCWNTCGRGAGIHGDFFECIHGFFPRLFSVPQHTNTHNITRRQTERDRERQRKKTEKERREDERGETRQDKRREESTRLRCVASRTLIWRWYVGRTWPTRRPLFSTLNLIFTDNQMVTNW